MGNRPKGASGPCLSLATARSHAQRAIFYNPFRYSDEIKTMLEAEGIQTAVSSIHQFRADMRRAGLPLPRLKRRSRPPRKTQFIERLVREMPRAAATTIAARAKQEGVVTTADSVRQVKRKMRARGIDVETCRTRLKPVPALTPNQKSLYSKWLPVADRFLSRELGRRPHLRGHREDIWSDIRRLLQRWVHDSPNPESPDFRKFLSLKVRYAFLDWMHWNLRQEMGISCKEVKTLFRLINGHRLGRTLEQTAERYDIPLQEAHELWEAYCAFKGRRALPEER